MKLPVYTFATLCLCVGLLNACSRDEPEPVIDEAAASSVNTDEDLPEARETKNVMYTGTVRTAGVSIYMQGSHRLELADGRFIFLESDTVDLNGYVGEQADVLGAVRPTVEEGSLIMRVEKISLVETEEEEASSSTAEEAEDEAESSEASEAASSAEAKEPEEPEEPLLEKPITEEELPAEPTAYAPSPQMLERIAAMNSEDIAAERWTQEYCTNHIGFCIPVHKNWWFKSFGTTNSNLWRVEISHSEVQNLNEGPIVVSLVPGPLDSADGQVQVQNGQVVGYRAWDPIRHFEITGDASLEAAVQYITTNLRSVEE